LSHGRMACDDSVVAVIEVNIEDLLQGPMEASRRHLDPQRVDCYSANLDQATPVTVFDSGDGLLLADGYHRVAAAQRLGRTTIRADVRRGTRSDALRFAIELAKQQRGLTEQQAIEAIRRRTEPTST
jgi:ParB-like nuclease domain